MFERNLVVKNKTGQVWRHCVASLKARSEFTQRTQRLIPKVF